MDGWLPEGTLLDCLSNLLFRDVRQNYFSHRVVNNWNSLPCSIVEAHSTDEFKKCFDNFNNGTMFSIDL